MQKHYLSWKSLLEKHQKLLTELSACLMIERKALLADDLEKLGLASIEKEKAALKIKAVENEIKSLKEVTAKDLQKDSNESLAELFNEFPSENAVPLVRLRGQLLRQSKAVKRINQFNMQCLANYMEYVGSIRKIINSAKEQDANTYSSEGITREAMNQGRLLDRSL